MQTNMQAHAQSSEYRMELHTRKHSSVQRCDQFFDQRAWLRTQLSQHQPRKTTDKSNDARLTLCPGLGIPLMSSELVTDVVAVVGVSKSVVLVLVVVVVVEVLLVVFVVVV